MSDLLKIGDGECKKSDRTERIKEPEGMEKILSDSKNQVCNFDYDLLFSAFAIAKMVSLNVFLSEMYFKLQGAVLINSRSAIYVTVRELEFKV